MNTPTFSAADDRRRCHRSPDFGLAMASEEGIAHEHTM
jgi:hypothetical protein